MNDFIIRNVHLAANWMYSVHADLNPAGEFFHECQDSCHCPFVCLFFVHCPVAAKGRQEMIAMVQVLFLAFGRWVIYQVGKDWIRWGLITCLLGLTSDSVTLCPALSCMDFGEYVWVMGEMLLVGGRERSWEMGCSLSLCSGWWLGNSIFVTTAPTPQFLAVPLSSL